MWSKVQTYLAQTSACQWYLQSRRTVLKQRHRSLKSTLKVPRIHYTVEILIRFFRFGSILSSKVFKTNEMLRQVTFLSSSFKLWALQSELSLWSQRTWISEIAGHSKLFLCVSLLNVTPSNHPRSETSFYCVQYWSSKTLSLSSFILFVDQLLSRLLHQLICFRALLLKKLYFTFILKNLHWAHLR